LLVGEALSFTNNCHCLRILPGLVLEELLDASVPRVRPLGSVPLDKYPMAFFFCEHQELRYRTVAADHRGFEQSSEGAAHLLNGLPPE
jgi:hypothetical protein